ncbi:Glucosamine-phosphate N-acetyltransferase-like protein [Actinomortierella ambigua]|uniref:Glucosamine 6-phosphate N-acetyltransferase n=1 Tax=Actinomortierella ambigua TaxID=1343610 RepID=A0A9P6QJS8_9FUNG|nr:Glucosamine-phosphate N-acetyltransferase-like protein [Actinomortierella ambigua]KAG0268943.1 Glucosamine-phosphate N-acetyltransferase-like protein [Actinomortierella ambigua]
MAAVDTPNTQDLLFNPSLIPDSLQALLPPGHVIRPLSKTDWIVRDNTSFLSTLEVLTTVGKISYAKFQERFDYLKQHNDHYYTIVIEDRRRNEQGSAETDLAPLGQGKIVAAGTVVVERKFIHELGKVGHIEDIAVRADQQGKKLGQRIIESLMSIGAAVGCYKVILDCSEKNVPFYEKCGFERKGVEMGWYVEKNKNQNVDANKLRAKL